MRMRSPRSAQHCQQHALPLVIARPVLVGEPEVAGHDGPVDGRDDLGQRDLLGRTGQHVTAAHARAWTAPVRHP